VRLNILENNKNNRIIITVIGKDQVGIVAKIATICADADVNIIDVSQTIQGGDVFTMSMLADITKINMDFVKLSDRITLYGEENNLKVFVIHEDVFNKMHNI
jgi:ACT domain-containing protein